MACECVTGPGIRGFNPVWSLVNLDGLQFDDTYYLWVLENEIPYIPAVVWHDPGMTTPWTSPVQFLANGTLPTDIYWSPTSVYRLEFRKNDGTLPPSQNDQLIYLIPNYIPGEELVGPTDVADGSTNNQITNGQFSEILFDGTYTLSATNPDPIELAPGWFLDLQGTGTVELQRIPLNNALANPTNAPYALRIHLTGSWTGTPVLRQRFQQNGMLWATKYVSTSLTARMDGTLQSLTARLDDSNGAPLQILLNTGTLTNNFVEYKGSALLPATTNPNLPPAAYIEYKVLLPTNVDLYITSFQVTASAVAGTFAYEQDTIDRQIDHTFHYFKPQLEYKPIPSYLTAWNFPLNPAQTGDAPGAQAIGANKSFYAWDQTICFQSVDSGVLVSRGANGGITFTANDPAGVQIAMIQYLGEQQARDILSGRSSVAIKASCSDLAEICTIGLYATNDAQLPDIKAPNYNSLVATLGANGNVASFNGVGWVPMARAIPGSNEFILTLIDQEFNINSWVDNVGTPRVSNATYFAIVIGTNLIANGQSVTFEYLTLNAGDISTRPAPQTADEIYDQCQNYFWSTFPVGTAPVQNAGLNTGYVRWQTAITSGSNIYTLRFPTIMRAVPDVVTYNPVALNADIRDFTATADVAATITNITTKSAELDANNPGGTVANILGVHAAFDARFGVVL